VILAQQVERALAALAALAAFQAEVGPQACRQVAPNGH